MIDGFKMPKKHYTTPVMRDNNGIDYPTYGERIVLWHLLDSMTTEDGVYPDFYFIKQAVKLNDLHFACEDLEPNVLEMECDLWMQYNAFPLYIPIYQARCHLADMQSRAQGEKPLHNAFYNLKRPSAYLRVV